MPELPEVETVARQLHPLVKGRQVLKQKIIDERLKTGPIPRLKGFQIGAVDRLGKQVRIRFDKGQKHVWLLVHLRMTGRLQWFNENAPRAPVGKAEVGYDTEVRSVSKEPKHLRAYFDCSGGRLLFIDTRRFGTFEWIKDEKDFSLPGIDPTTEAFSVETLRALLKNSKTPLKPWLLRQDRIVGLGNIYASEICWDAKLSPKRAAGGLTKQETGRLHHSTLEILMRAIENCGTTFSDFQDAQGLTGSYQAYLKVYAREGEPCPDCRQPIRRIVQQQRSTFYCPKCQRTR